MNIPGLTNGVSSYATNVKDTKTSKTAAAAAAASAEKETAVKEEASSNKKQDTIDFSGKNNATQNTYKKNQLNSQQVQQLMSDAEARANNMTKMIQSMIVKQGQKSNLRLFGMDLFVTPEQSAQAAKSLEPGGEHSVDAVAGRIMDMAKALSGGDPSKIDKLQNAVIKGFKAAGVELGGKLPDISNQTYNEVMKRFDDWKNEANKSTTDPTTNTAAYQAASAVAAE